MEPQEVGEFKFSYKKPEEELYSLWVEDCAYSFDKETAQEFVDHMREEWPDLDYGADATKEEKHKENLKYHCDHIKYFAKQMRRALGEKPEEAKKSFSPEIEKFMGQWRTRNACNLVNELAYIRYSYYIDDKVRSKEFMIDECHQLIDAIIEALEEKNE